jgi:FkbM family methyltransferase
MLKLMKRAIRRGIHAAGYTLVPLAPGTPIAEPTTNDAAGVASSGNIPPPVDLTASDTPPVRVGHSARIDFVGIAIDQPIPSTIDRFAEVEALLARVTPWSGHVPNGYVADFLGTLTDGSFIWNRTGPCGGNHVVTKLPTLASEGEHWFEIADWLYSAYAASGQFVAISLGASFGAQLVGAWKALQAINSLPARLVGVEPVATNCQWMRKHMAINGIDPDQHWIIQAALGVDNEPNLFPVGAPGTGLTNSVQTHSIEARQSYADLFSRSDYGERVLRNIFLYNSTGSVHQLQYGYIAEVKFVSAVTLPDVLAPFDRVDLLEVDIQQAEAHVIPPFMNLLNRKVRRVHIGTHGRAVHAGLRGLFSAAGWEIVFDYAPEMHHITERGSFDTEDGILTARNPAA